MNDTASRGQNALRRAAVGLWPLLYLVAPAALLVPAVGPHRSPGLPAEPLFATLVSGAQVQRWLTGADLWGVTGLIEGAFPYYWPAQLSVAGPLAVLRFVLSEPFSYGLLLLVALWFAGLGPALLARRLLGREQHAAWLIAGLAVQLSPPVLRCAWDGQLAVLGVGPLCLALAARRGWAAFGWGLLAGGMGAVTAGLAALSAILDRRWWAISALLPPVLLAAVLWGYQGSAPLPGSTTAPVELAFTPAYVGTNGAVFPRVGEQAWPTSRSEPGRPWTSLPARLHGGPLALLGCLLGLAWRRVRPWALLGLGALLLLHLGLGPMPPPGVEAGEPAAWLAFLFGGLPGGAGPPELLIPVVLAAGLGLGALVGWRREASVLVLAVCLWTSPLLPLGRLPVTNLPPLPAADALAALEPGPVLLLPVVESPFRQAGAGDAELMHLAARIHRPLPLDMGACGIPLVAHISRIADLPVHQGAAEAIWSNRDQVPLDAARAQGFRGLILDTESLTPTQLGLIRLDLQRSLGPPIAEGERWLVWGL